MATLLGANEYHSQRLTKEAWTAVPEEKQKRALLAAGEVLAQLLPRGTSDAADRAVYEQAVYMLGTDYENAVNGVTSLGLTGLSMGWQRQASVPAGVAPRAWNILVGGGGTVRGGSIR